MKHKYLVTAGVAATLAAAGLGASTYAATQHGGDNGLVEAIASKFNLDKTKVQEVFDEQRSKMEAQREQELKDKLASLVKDGKLTQAQADKITAKRAEMKKEMEAKRSESAEKKDRSERKTEMEAKKKELDAWLKANDISSDYASLLMGGGPGGHGGPGGPGGFGGPRGK